MSRIRTCRIKIIESSKLSFFQCWMGFVIVYNKSVFNGWNYALAYDRQPTSWKLLKKCYIWKICEPHLNCAIVFAGFWSLSLTFTILFGRPLLFLIFVPRFSQVVRFDDLSHPPSSMLTGFQIRVFVRPVPFHIWRHIQQSCNLYSCSHTLVWIFQTKFLY